jgi:CRP-like cAMP-binding protein
LFSGLETYDKLKLIDGLKLESFTKNQFIFNEGDDGDEFYIIESGELECLKVAED